MSTISIAEWVKKLDAMSNGGLQKILKKHAKKAGLLGEREAKLAATSNLRTRSGRLRTSIRHELRQSSGGGLDLVLRAGGGSVTGGAITIGGVRYAGLQEYGGTVTPKMARNLAIPLRPALTSAGVPRWIGGPRGAPVELKFAPMRGKKFLVDRATGTPYYILVPSVTIRGAHFLRSGQRVARDHLLRELAGAVRAAVDTSTQAPGGEP